MSEVAHVGTLIVVEEDGLRKLALSSDEGIRSLEGALYENGELRVYAGGYAPTEFGPAAVGTYTPGEDDAPAT